ncbi:MAG: tRNA (adenosine(37)-N6)-threonylcarbamoyltransferase complex transferase subunit TsaD [Candidatus Taylorbacteria bacterium]|nr:tRNA (adenosine(37)-N6)-threonylcarbamoyltransferase complex transferase subunit TsaD [Candidatus Taylorbacteria bacterium]
MNEEDFNLKSLILNLLTILAREPELLKQFTEFVPKIEKPPIDKIAVTVGPGLEPALWVGINFAKALFATWNIPITPTNHMEGHIISAMAEKIKTPSFAKATEGEQFSILKPEFPAVALLISGGHTELVLVKKLGDYEILGETRDDAAGEAFDKVARILGLPYPGGPQIARLAEGVRNKLEETRKQKRETRLKLPRPMLKSNGFDFSFAGLKTAVLYKVKEIQQMTEEIKAEIALEFENAVTEVLAAKTRKAVENFKARTLIAGGGVIANKHIRSELEKLARTKSIPLLLPEPRLATDNAFMIALAGSVSPEAAAGEEIKALGTLKLKKLSSK